MNKKYFFALLVDFWRVRFPPGVLVHIFPQKWRVSVCGIWTEKSGSTKKTGTTAAGTTKTATKDRKVYRRILMRSAPVSGKK